ncbi:cell wall protein AWA1-like isoform X1 [Miscanthus floridulus]|uniref:cell wall protein AWA1-like isoform X1 n=1 Tax=Miscanthus floridulus TaxID=154761 RepID=UPI0034581FA5
MTATGAGGAARATRTSGLPNPLLPPIQFPTGLVDYSRRDREKRAEKIAATRREGGRKRAGKVEKSHPTWRACPCSFSPDASLLLSSPISTSANRAYVKRSPPSLLALSSSSRRFERPEVLEGGDLGGGLGRIGFGKFGLDSSTGWRWPLWSNFRWQPTRPPLPIERAVEPPCITLWIPATWICQGRSTCPRRGSRTRSRSSGRSGRRTSTGGSLRPCSCTVAPGAAYKVVRESSSGTGSNASAGAAPAIQIPPPRPKRKPAHPYPRKVDAAAKKPAPEFKQLEKPPPLRDQDEEGSPTSVLTSAHTVLRAEEGLGSVFANSSSASRSPALSAAGSDERGNGGGSLASSVDGEDACASPRTTAPYTTKVLGDANEVGSEAPIFKLFGKKVVVEDLKTDSSPASAVQATRNGNPIGAAGATSPWNLWQGSVQVQQLMYLVPQPDGFAAQPVVPWFGYNGSLPCAVFYPQAVASSAQEHQQQQQASELLDHRRAQREGSLTGSNMAASSAAAVPAASAAQNSDPAESSRHGPGQENTTSDGYAALRRAAAVPRLTKCASSASFCGRGFVPYKRCAAESEAPRPVAPGEEADGELTRLCL